MCIDFPPIHEYHRIHRFAARESLKRARRFIEGFEWCSRIDQTFVALHREGVVTVVLVHIEPARTDVDKWLWVVVGDLPSAYLVTDEARDATSALRVYIRLMTEWVRAVRNGDSVEDLIPVNVLPTIEWANALDNRLHLLEKHLT